MGALHVDMTLRGPELLVPRVRLMPLPLPLPLPLLPSSSSSFMDVIIADYTLTVEGTYQLQLDLQGFYPAMLAASSSGSSSSSSSSSGSGSIEQGEGGRGGGAEKRKLTAGKNKNKPHVKPKPMKKRSHLRADRLPSYKHPEHKLLPRKSPLSAYDRFEVVFDEAVDEKAGELPQQEPPPGRSSGDSLGPLRVKPVPSILQRLRDTKEWIPRFADDSGGDNSQQHRSHRKKHHSVNSTLASPSSEPITSAATRLLVSTLTNPYSAKRVGSRYVEGHVHNIGNKNIPKSPRRPSALLHSAPSPGTSSKASLHKSVPRPGVSGRTQPHHTRTHRDDPSSQSELGLIPSIFLGDCEKRVESGRQYFCLPECEEESQVQGSPFVVHATNGREHCGEEVTADVELPFCTSGSHPGRYLHIPQPLVKLCGAEKYTAMYRKEKKAQEGKRQNFDKYAAIQSLYNEHANSVKLKKEEVSSILASGKGELSASYQR
jgi:hypothetical protein